jgi:serine O-acetyltransferase
MKNILLALSAIRCIPHLIAFLVSRKKATITADYQRWLYIMDSSYKGLMGLVYLLTFYPEFRNLFYHRIGVAGHLLNIICQKERTLHLLTPDIGSGLYIQHGFATIITAKSIGSNCWINQQVTVGFSSKNESPVIEDNVIINAGAKVIGGVVVGKNSVVGANAVVVKNVPSDCVVAGVPARIIRQDGERINKAL